MPVLPKLQKNKTQEQSLKKCFLGRMLEKGNSIILEMTYDLSSHLVWGSDRITGEWIRYAIIGKWLIYRISEALLYQPLLFRHKYEFLHNRTTPDIRITVSPRKIGILLDYENSRLSFFNADIPQHLYTFSCQLHQFVHPCFSLEKPGCLKIHNGIAKPKHVTFY
jgi:hypothetical protein